MKSQRVRLLEKALQITMHQITPYMPGDSRAVPDWFVACAAVQCELDDSDGRIESCLDAYDLSAEISIETYEIEVQ